MCLLAFSWPLIFFFLIELYELFVYFGNEFLVRSIVCKYFHPVCKLSFCFMCGVFLGGRGLLYESFYFGYFCFQFNYSGRQIQKNIGAVYVKQCCTFDFLQKFRSLMHFVFIFVCDARECSDVSFEHSMLLHVAVQLYQHCFLKRLSFTQCIFLLPFSQIN